MGNQPSRPRHGARIQVIGAGLSRTGTASLSAALSCLLSGPVYHCGTQICRGSPSEILTWIDILNIFPARTPRDLSKMHNLLQDRLDGFVAVTDAPAAGLVPELLQLFPDAKRSMTGLVSAATLWFLRAVLLPLPGLRYIPAFTERLQRQWGVLYDEKGVHTRLTYERHIAWLKEVVPEDRLVFFDVRDGWDPLCASLGLETPDVAFPNINDGAAIEAFAQETIRKGLMWWAVYLGGIAAGGVYWEYFS
ncbi:hypothetical protein KVT40_003692 [Elsinoe batatas]|uniref:NAD dependent epimerase/dehydratase n=1 Tax=Elsinoe batatas TaxID=2601811 RepID=A0A8K0L3J2_9PEZI|nr:hypothetical protein KVT40_003692 [Elsinoe batatas]